MREPELPIIITAIAAAAVLITYGPVAVCVAVCSEHMLRRQTAVMLVHIAQQLEDEGLRNDRFEGMLFGDAPDNRRLH